jgi:hypothetical protein
MLNKQQDFRAIEIMKSGTAKDQASAFLMEKELRANIEAAMIESEGNNRDQYDGKDMRGRKPLSREKFLQNIKDFPEFPNEHITWKNINFRRQHSCGYWRLTYYHKSSAVYYPGSFNFGIRDREAEKFADYINAEIDRRKNAKRKS